VAWRAPDGSAGMCALPAGAGRRGSGP
jgi:hypothetical protein